MNSDNHISVEIRINSNDYYINMFVIENEHQLVVEVSDMYSADLWKGSFDAASKLNQD